MRGANIALLASLLLPLLFPAVSPSFLPNETPRNTAPREKTSPALAALPANHLRYFGALQSLFDVEGFDPASLNTNFPAASLLAEGMAAMLSAPAPDSLQISSKCNLTLAYVKSNGTIWFYMLDAFGKPKSGISQGAMAWPGSYDLCVDSLKMRHCMMPFNTSFAKGNPIFVSSLAGAAFGSKFTWGICVPRQCNDIDALEFANYLVAEVTKNVPLLSKLKVEPGVCRSSDDPAPTFGAGMIVFFVVIGVIGALTVLGTAYDYLFVDLKLLGAGSADDVGFGWRKMETVEGAGNGGEQIQVEGNSRAGPNWFVKLILCFSMLSNGRKILSLEPATDNIGCINGIRFLSLTWVILGHTYAFVTPALTDAFYVFFGLAKRVSIQPILNGTFSVDSFFVLSGLLTAYLFFKRYGGKKQTLNEGVKTVAHMYLHRYLRLTPALAILMGFNQCLPLLLTTGPFAATEPAATAACNKYWWYNILYINNLNQDAMGCVGHVWYLANDMQFFVLSPIFLYAFWYHKAAGLVVSALFWLGSMSALIEISDKNKSGILLTDMGENMNDIYVKPWTRIGPYIIGLVAGYFLYEFRKNEKQLHWLFVVVMWALSCAIGLAVIYGLESYYSNGTKPTRAEDIIYLTFSRSAWAIAVSWVIFACALGYGGPINTLLSWSAFGPVSRINYSAYLYHLMVMGVIVGNMRDTFAYSDYFFATCYVGILIISYGVAFLAAMWFESPIIGIEKMIRGK